MLQQSTGSLSALGTLALCSADKVKRLHHSTCLSGAQEGLLLPNLPRALQSLEATGGIHHPTRQACHPLSWGTLLAWPLNIFYMVSDGLGQGPAISILLQLLNLHSFPSSVFLLEKGEALYLFVSKQPSFFFFYSHSFFLTFTIIWKQCRPLRHIFALQALSSLIIMERLTCKYNPCQCSYCLRILAFTLRRLDQLHLAIKDEKGKCLG